jgi:hypothetical protein
MVQSTKERVCFCNNITQEKKVSGRRLEGR